MKIQILNIEKTPHFNKQNKLQTNNSKTKEIEILSTNLSANYNIAFTGLFSNKSQKPKYDATRLTFEHKMETNIPYLVSEDSCFSLNGFIINLQNETEKSLIKQLKAGDSLVFGRESTFLQGMHSGVSRKHLKIEKTKDNKLIATDVGSKYGTSILPNIQTPNTNTGSFMILPKKKYLLPTTSVFDVGGYTINLSNFSEEISQMKDKDTKKFTIFNEVPLQIEKFGDNIIAENLSNSINTTFMYLNETPFVNDLSRIWGTAMLQVNVPTLIPKNCHLRLGTELTIDTRDKKINELLNKKQRILIGRSPNCDYVVDSFNNKVSDVHLSLEKTSKGLVATDLNSSNLTFVIPNKDIKAFYNGVENIFIKQGNIGDCSLLSTLYSLYSNPKGREIIQNMVSINADGDYLVQFYGKDPIKVKLDELYGQENKKGERKIAVEGELGIKAIERAYAKYINRGFSPTMFGEIDNGLPLKKPLSDITGKKPTYLRIHNNGNIDGIFYNIINNEDTNSHVITCATPRLGKFGQYMDSQNRFISNHAYSIQNINLQGRYLEIVNPHNTKGVYVLPFDDFTKYFSELCYLKL